MENKKEYIRKIGTFGLFKRRHPVGEHILDFIFEETLKDVTDIGLMQRTIARKLRGYDYVELYVTGLTVALVEVINYCSIHKIELVFYHYNRDTRGYYKQNVVTK